MLKSLFSKVAGLQACIFLKKRPQHMCFPVSIAKFLRAAFSVEHLWLVLYKTPVAASEIPLDTSEIRP